MKKRPDNPGTFARGNVGFANDTRQWSEQIDAVDALDKSLRRAGHSPNAAQDILTLPDRGLRLMPLLVGGVTPRPEGGVRTTTTIQIGHDDLFPNSVFEFQHALGANVAESLEQGFAEFATLDLVAILDALAVTPSTCRSMAREFQATERLPARTRRVVFGPVSGAGAAQATQSAPDDAHPSLCPCCMLTRSLPAFEAFLAGNSSTAIRMYAMRAADGGSQADCRVNGISYPIGAAALRRYVASWTGDGFAYRKQYVIVHTIAP